MEKIEQVIDLPKLNAVVVAHNKDIPSFLNILLSEEELAEDNYGYGWYLYLEHVGRGRKFPSAYIELEPEEVQFLQNTLRKAVFKLAILDKVKIEGLYSVDYDGIRNLKLEIKSRDDTAWLELVLSNKSQKKYVTHLAADDVRAIVQKLQSVKAIGDNMVKQLETIEALTENLAKQSAMPQPAAATPAGSPVAPSEPIDATKLVKHLETMAKKTKKIY